MVFHVVLLAVLSLKLKLSTNNNNNFERCVCLATELAERSALAGGNAECATLGGSG